MNNSEKKSEEQSKPAGADQKNIRNPLRLAQIHCSKGEMGTHLCRCHSVECQVGHHYVVDTGRGQVCGKALKVFEQTDPKPGEKPVARVKYRLLREVSEKDRSRARDNELLEEKAFKACSGKIKSFKLPMKLIKAYCLFDTSKIIFYFSSDSRVDFRNLVKELASEFHTRIEMKQIGVRDEAKMIGGCGGCGQPLCCATFLKGFEPVSIKMAKIQNISLDATKISGVCNRLMCCLAYEYPLYDSVRKKMPRMGDKVFVDQVEGKVDELDLLQEKISVKFPDRALSFTLDEYKKLEKPKNKPSGSGGGKFGKSRPRKKSKTNFVKKEAPRKPKDN